MTFCTRIMRCNNWQFKAHPGSDVGCSGDHHSRWPLNRQRRRDGVGSHRKRECRRDHHRQKRTDVPLLRQQFLYSDIYSILFLVKFQTKRETK